MRKLLIAIFLSALFAACQPSAKQSPLYDSGVSRELAILRKQVIEDLKYELFFSLPAEKTQPVTGEATVRFVLAQPQEVILDFREPADKIAEVKVNGQPADYRFRNEHIILPPSAMQAGENAVYIRFTAGDQSLNRNEEFLYTLLVPDRARTVFPCFEQPDLKAEFTLSLDVPAGWKAVSNTYQTVEIQAADGRKTIRFAPTEPLSTYLFAFAAGKFERQEYTKGDRTIAAYYRETDPKKLAQLDIIFEQVMAALEWQEEFTGVPYPFAKYVIVILPGFQYGGMEHTGATFYNDTQLFLSEHPTPDELLRRAQLIAHETSHMWFGDYVTMRWFDDVWTKEVFANYFAACIVEPMFPDVNHDLNWLRTYTAASLSEDRTQGTTSIKQPLENLSDAGLIYGQIIYNKAPVMMKKLVELMGWENFREGIREYVRTYAYGNADWDDLVRILNKHSATDLEAFSRVWVHEKGMPSIKFLAKGNRVEVRQDDPYRRGLLWRQRFDMRVMGERDTVVEVDMRDTILHFDFPFEAKAVLPNVDGRGYGLIKPNGIGYLWILFNWPGIRDDMTRQSLLMLVYENYLAGDLEDDEMLTFLFRGIGGEQNPLILSSMASYFAFPLWGVDKNEAAVAEQRLYNFATSHPVPSCRTQLLRVLIANHRSSPMVLRLYDLWENRSEPLLNEDDYTTLAYELCLRLPKRSAEILATQRSRITNPDRLRQFDFIARALTPDTKACDTLFRSLLKAENRRIEPWTATVLRYLNHPLRDEYSVKYIRPALEALQDVQRTGDIFFPKNWVSALLGGHRCEAAYEEVQAFLADHPDYPVLLKNKILQAAYPLYRLHGGGE